MWYSGETFLTHQACAENTGTGAQHWHMRRSCTMSTDYHTTDPSIPLKKCTTCGEEKPLTSEYFRWRTDWKPGWRLNCRACVGRRERERHAGMREQRRASSKQYYAQHADVIQAREMERYWARKAGTFAPTVPPIVTATVEDTLQAFARTERALSRKAEGRPALKKCSKCGIEKPWTSEYFHQRTSRKRGLAYRCKDCQLAYMDAIPPEKRREAARETYAKHSGKKRSITQRRRARKRQLPDTWTSEHWQRCLQYWAYSCAVCGREEGFEWVLSMDHFIPLSSPECPGTIPGNIIPLCYGKGGCNNSKHTHPITVWLRRKYSTRKANEILRRIAAYFAWVTKQEGVH